ncbi:YkvA family protein [Jiella sonneratiae]|uniref:DUF1232 domain-containing protein n=1 Tax=Jiella sonneratiae TaxID=2816856 RepID=A0ABS3IYM6_9HYPH|nr:YkvA family protein [Jiella sonneratiae]MBO0902020.1 DUF1232 domain-containing protein [Jiella sonneratiae]
MKRAARRLRRDVLVLWLAARDPQTPVFAKLVAGAVAAYALSPIDLVPDFVPVLGLLDDLLIVPLGIMLAVRLIPPDRLEALRRAADRRLDRPTSVAGAVIVAAIWLGLSGLAAALVLDRPGVGWPGMD